MSTYISLTALERNGRPYTKTILVDVNKIALPIVENSLNNSVIEVDTDVSFAPEHFGSREKYVVDEDLAAIDALTDEVFLGTIISKNDRDDLYPEALFVKSRVVGVVTEQSPGGHSEFRYRDLTNRSGDFYVVNETLATINS